jgi:hypothetical protein
VIEGVASVRRRFLRPVKALLDEATPLRDESRSEAAREFIALVAANVERYLDYYCHELAGIGASTDDDLVDAIDSSLSEVSQWRWFFVQAGQYQDMPATHAAVSFGLLLARLLYVARAVPAKRVHDAPYASCGEMKRIYASPKFRTWRAANGV